MNQCAAQSMRHPQVGRGEQQARRLFYFVMISALCAIGAPAATAADAQYKSDKGFTIDYPSNWQVATPQELQKMEQQVRDAIHQKGLTDTSQVALFIKDPAPSLLQANINVTVKDGMIPLTDSDDVNVHLRQTAKQLSTAYGLQLAEFNAGIETMGENKCAIARYRLAGPGGSMRQIQMSVPVNRKTYIFTCTSQGGEASKKYDPLFEKMLASVKIERGFLGNLPPWAVYAIIGGIAGGIIALVAGMTRKAKVSHVR
jgi:hypothetical protein